MAGSIRAPLARDLVGFEQTRWRVALPILPSPTVTVMIQLAERFPGTPVAFVAGPATSAAMVFPVGPAVRVDVKLKPIGAARLFGPVLDELADRRVELDALLPARSATRFVDQLVDAGWDHRLALVEGLLADQVAAAPAIEERVAWAWQQLWQSCGAVPIGHLVAEVGWSHRHFIRQFRRHTGLTPKAAGQLIRLSTTLAALQAGEGSLAGLAVRAGYYDQAHMARELRRAVDATPGQIIRCSDPAPPASVARSPGRQPPR